MRPQAIELAVAAQPDMAAGPEDRGRARRDRRVVIVARVGPRNALGGAGGEDVGRDEEGQFGIVEDPLLCQEIELGEGADEGHQQGRGV